MSPRAPSCRSASTPPRKWRSAARPWPSSLTRPSASGDGHPVMLGQLVNPVHRLIDSLRRDTARTLLMAAALGLVGWLVLYPLAILLLLGLHDKDGARTFDNYRPVFTAPRLGGRRADA